MATVGSMAMIQLKMAQASAKTGVSTGSLFSKSTFSSGKSTVSSSDAMENILKGKNDYFKAQYKKLYRRYDMFMRGKDAETLEDTILDLMDEAAFLRSEDRANKDLIESMEEQVKAGYQKTGIVKYNAFKGMGGNLSFVIALLDDNNTGFVLNSVHSLSLIHI